MGKSEELIKVKLHTAKLSSTVKFKKGKEFRKITDDGVDAFVQRLADARGNFVRRFRGTSTDVAAHTYAVCVGDLAIWSHALERTSRR